jgi:hypothetical protein
VLINRDGYDACGRRLLFKGGSSSSSSSSTTTSTDKRLAIDSGIGISSDQSNVTVNNSTLDAGIVHDALQLLAAGDVTGGKSLSDVVGLADNSFSKLVSSQNDAFGQVLDAQSGVLDAGQTAFGKVLGLADKLFSGGFDALKTSQQLTESAFSTATNDKAGTIDNRTIAIVVVAGAAAWAFSKAKK